MILIYKYWTRQVTLKLNKGLTAFIKFNAGHYLVTNLKT